MNNYYASPIMSRARDCFEQLYGAVSERLLARFAVLIGRYGNGSESRRPPLPVDQGACLLIAYADTIRNQAEPSLAVMARFLDSRVGRAITHLHILPFYASSSDDGFAVVHFRTVDPAYGAWAHLQALSESRDLVFDVVLNHVSSQSGWFQDYIAGIAPGRDYFIEADPGDHALANVARPRNSALLTPVWTSAGLKHVWTTFSADQVDLNYANHDVLFEMLDIALFYIAMGARVLRLDAVAYLWKRLGTNCLHLPETHKIVGLLRDLLALSAPDVRLLTETNLPPAENLAYFGNGNEAHWIYQFSLPPLLLHALLRGNCRYLADWAADLPTPPAGCAYLNMTGSHDGVGLRPLEGLVPEPEIAWLADQVVRQGGRVSMRRTVSGADAPYELNSTWFDALGALPGDTPELHMARFLCAQAVLMTFKGIPAVYFNTLIAARNDQALAERTGMNRSLNRGKWDLAGLDAALADPQSPIACSLAAHLRMLKIRARHPAFHPDGGQKTAALTDCVLAIERQAPDGAECILALANFSSQPRHLSRDQLQAFGQINAFRDLLTGRKLPGNHDDGLALEPYAVVWLVLS